MPQDDATTIAQLKDEWPLRNDPVNEGDDHIRTVKTVLKKQFPGSNGQGLARPTEVSETEFDNIQGSTSNLQGQIDTIDAPTMKQQISANEQQIETNRIQIATNTFNIDQGGQNLAEIDARVTTNEQDIASNDNSITGLQTDVDLNTQDISSLQSSVNQLAEADVKVAGLFSGINLAVAAEFGDFDVIRDGTLTGNYIVTLNTPMAANFVTSVSSDAITGTERINATTFKIVTLDNALQPYDAPEVNFMVVG